MHPKRKNYAFKSQFPETKKSFFSGTTPDWYYFVNQGVFFVFLWVSDKNSAENDQKLYDFLPKTHRLFMQNP